MTTKTKPQLTQEQRYTIATLLSEGFSKPYIAKKIGVHPTTVYRELNRNSVQKANGQSLYKAGQAQNFAGKRAYRPQALKSSCPIIIRRMVWLLKRDWSPEQISQCCKQRGLAMLSTEAIYLWVYEQKAKNTEHTYLVHHLRRSHRRRRKRRLDNQPRTIIKDKKTIDQRPAIVEEQKRTGDLETDLVKCTNGYILTVTDRKTLFNLLVKIPNKEAATVQAAIIKALEPYKGNIFTITSDNGTEFARHAEAAKALGVDWYFADPYRSQQRGCNENQNGLVRQYLKRHTDLSLLTDQDIKDIQNKLNYRPRKKLNFQSPIKLFLLPPGVALVG